jgi:hypothetical protein
MKTILLSSLLVAVLSGCSYQDKDLCRENITDEHIYHSILTQAERISRQVAQAENDQDRRGRFCQGLRCSLFEPWGYVEAGDFSQYLSIVQIAVTTAPLSGRHECTASITLSLPTQAHVPHTVSWSLTKADPYPILGSMNHRTDDQLWAWVNDHTHGEVELLRSSRKIARWARDGWIKPGSMDSVVAKFQEDLATISARTGVEYFSRLKEAVKP